MFYKTKKYKQKIPPKIILQVWDRNFIGNNSHIAEYEISLLQMKKPFLRQNECSIEKTSLSEFINVFKTRQIKGWFPFYEQNNNGEKQDKIQV